MSAAWKDVTYNGGDPAQLRAFAEFNAGTERAKRVTRNAPKTEAESKRRRRIAKAEAAVRYRARKKAGQ